MIAKSSREDWLRRIGEGAPHRATFRFVHANGEYRWVDMISRPEFADDGEVASYIGVAIDITEQKRITEALGQSQRLFQTLANLSPAAIVRADAIGRPPMPIRPG